MSRPALFLDRDGVINRRDGYVRVESDFVFEPSAREAFGILGQLQTPIVIVTNQSGIGRGYTTPEVVDRIHTNLCQTAREWGAEIASIELCPHLPSDNCDCRKPEPGLFLRAQQKHDLDFERSFLIGDAPSDIEAAHRLGIRPVRVETGRGSEPLAPGVELEACLRDFCAAAEWIAARFEDEESR